MNPSQVDAHGKAMLLVFLLGLPAILSLLHPGTVSGHDIQYHTVALGQFHEALRAGEWFPRWAPDMAAGYGYPNFVFYPPLAYYLAMIPVWLGATYAGAWDIAIGAFLLASGLTTYVLAAPLWGRVAGVVAGVAYMYAPYHLVVAYVKGAVPELLGMALWPLALLFLVRIHRGAGTRNVVGFAIVLAATLLAHSLSALLLAGMTLVHSVTLAALRRDPRPLVRVATATLLGLALAVFVWWPALAESRLVQSNLMTIGYFNFAAHFVPVLDLVHSGWNYGASGYPAQFSRSLGPAQWLGLLGALVLFRRPGGRGERFALLVLALLCLFLCVRLSAPLWEAIPLLAYLQFPWKFLAPAALAGSLLLGWLVAEVPVQARRPIAGLALALVLGFGVRQAHPWQQIMREEDFGTPVHVRELTFRATGADVTHIYTSYLPKTAVLQPTPRSVPADGEGMVVEGEPGRLTVEARQAGMLRLHVYAFPGWRVEVDGERVPVTTAPESGFLALQLPVGRHEVTYAFGASPTRAASAIVSLLAWLGLLAWLAWRYRRRLRTRARA